MYLKENSIIYYNGKFIRAAELRIDFLSQTLHYGYGVFDGIRSYNTFKGVNVFRDKQHYDRLKNGCELVGIPTSFNSEELCDVTYSLLEMNKLTNAYIRPLVFCGQNMALTEPKEINILIAAWEWGNYLGNKPINLFISSFERPNPKSVLVEAKATGHYINSILATRQAKANGYDEALMLDMNGNVAEASGANIFIEKDGSLYTPPKGFILPGITRQVIFSICKELNFTVLEKDIKPEELLDCDSIFLCGTATEIVGVESVNGVKVKKTWIDSCGAKIQDMYKVKTLFGELKPV